MKEIGIVINVKNDKGGLETIERDYKSLFTQIEANANKVFDNLEKRSKTALVSKAPNNDAAMQRALADVEKYKQSSIRIEQDITNQIAKQAEAQYQARTKQWQRGLAEFEKIANQENKLASTSGSGNNSFIGSFLGNVGANVVSETSSLLKQGASAWLDYASKIEQARIGFTSMTGSAVIADEHLKELQNFAKTTPFQFDELVTASQKLQGVGVNAKNVIPILKDVGNSLAAAGRIGDLPEAAKALADIQAKGKLAGQEIIQLSNAGVPAFKILAETTGKSQAEIVKLSESGAISSKLFLDALHQYSEQHFGDAMEKQSRTFQGALSNIEDALLITANTAFEPFYKKISGLSVELADSLGNAQDFGQVSSLIGKRHR